MQGCYHPIVCITHLSPFRSLWESVISSALAALCVTGSFPVLGAGLLADTHFSSKARNSSPFPHLFLASYFNLTTSWPAPSPSLPCVCARPLSSVRQDQPHIQPCNPKLIHTASRPPSCGTFPGRLPSHSRGLAAQTVCNHFVLQPLTQR